MNLLSKKRVKESLISDESLEDYKDKVNKFALDFDFEKRCCETGFKLNVFCCLQCGKYFQGKNDKTPAFKHSLDKQHCLFICLSTLRIYYLPDDYEVKDEFFEEIRNNINPIYNLDKVNQLDTIGYSSSLEGSKYLPGCIGLNNIKKHEYSNVIYQVLFKIKPIRNYFLLLKPISDQSLPSQFINDLSNLYKKYYNKYNFKNHISPHEIMQTLQQVSKNQFKIVSPSDSINFLAWILNMLNNYFTNHLNNSLISDCFQGKLNLETYTKLVHDKYVDSIVIRNDIKYKYENKIIDFYYLSLDLPKEPLFKDQNNKVSIPQVSIYSLLEKYNNQEIISTDCNIIKKYSILKLPSYLILFFKRFEKNMFFQEKNTTIVNFPIKDLMMLENKEIKKYDLIGNIIHEGKANDGKFKIQIKNNLHDDFWSEINDLTVKSILTQDLLVAESYIQFYQGVQYN